MTMCVRVRRSGAVQQSVCFGWCQRDAAAVCVGPVVGWGATVHAGTGGADAGCQQTNGLAEDGGHHLRVSLTTSERHNCSV